ncbi:tetratricopeptide repeat protein [Streptomyces sp. 3MP-14]|uniref:Tetratricopeptide repeat protein n=1 Tax=Streptomyces mimosae TaxID=2586635 RepID=A0A5N6ATK6_9ACTN|nr:MULTISPECIES: FxSxx-COOH system tetratricopeptide repeat protein [Streptomyces]KAB8171048.1 tetratricopeptide repeat protein [Streptomyces mimosae]KAB8179601.1 tetratricopeptide repeat protein [Streptomyces sp. 3MP-14]
MQGSAHTTAPPAEARRITISYAGYNRAWAVWIADRLERYGWQVAFQRFDLPAGVQLHEALTDLLLVRGRILVVLSDWYFKLGPRTDQEWNEALRAVVAPNSARFHAVSVSTAPMPSATAAFGGTTELWGLGAREAERRLIQLVGAFEERDPARDTLGGSQGPRFPMELPRVWGGVPRRNSRFTGRERLLQSIHDQVQNAEPGTGVVALLGLSGVGKTQVAAEYAWRFSSSYDLVWWVPADQRGTLRQRLAELAPSLNLTTGPEYGERLRAVGDALRRGRPYARWLVVLDGADSPETIADLVPTGNGHVLITSQNGAWGDYNNTHLLPVPVYEREESVAFVRRRAPRIGRDDADLLARTLGDLPLALDQTAGWLSDSTMTVREYVGLLRDDEDIEVGLRVAVDFDTSYPTAFSILLNRLRETVPEAVELLRLCAFFAPGAIPVQLLREIPAEHLPEQLAGLMSDPLRWNTATNKLVQYSVIQWDPPNTDEDPEAAGTIMLHGMVQRTVRSGMSEVDREVFSRAVRRGLANADPAVPTDTRLWPRYARIVPHLDASGALYSRHADMHTLIRNCLRYLYLAGEYVAGIQLTDRVERAWREVFGEGHPLLRDLASQQAMLLRATGEYARTERINRGLLRRLEEEGRGDDSLDVLRVLEGLGADLRGLGRYEEALDTSERVLAGRRRMIGEEDFRTLNSRNNLAVTLRLLGRYRDALVEDRRTLQTRREVLRARNSSTLSSETNYAIDLRLLGRYAEAQSIQEPNVEVQRTVMGHDHPQTLSAELNLALCLLRSGERTAAHERLADLLERAERALGEASPATQRIAACYAFVLRSHGRLDLAREIGERTTRRYRQALGAEHPFTVGTLANHALLLRAAGEREEALELNEQCLIRMTDALGPDHPWRLGLALNLSADRNIAGDVESAAELSRDTARRAAEHPSLGREHPLTLSCKVAHATDLRNLRQRAEADKTEEEALTGLISTLGSQHVHTVSARARVRPFWDFEPQLT